MKNNTNNDIIANKSKIMLIALIIIIALITVIFVSIGNLLQKDILKTITTEEKKVAQQIYQQTFDNFIDKYELIASNLLMNEEIIASFEKKDRTKLLKLTLPIYEKLQNNNPYLQIMHFHTTDTKSFLRVHKPNKFGDDLSSIRHMINKVNKEKIKQIGIEVGRYGIHYRVALPIFNSSKDFLGVFEFGININYILDIFKNNYSLETILLFKKDVFNIIFKNYNGVEYSPYSEDFYSIKLDNYNSKIKANGSNNTTFKIHTIEDNSKQNIGEILFIKDLSDCTDNIEKGVNLAVVISVLFVLFAFYIIRRLFNNYIKTIDSFQKELEVKNDSLLKLSNTDHMTQIHNRKSIEGILQNEQNRVKRYKHPLSIILFDVDNFKKINDTLGHNVGDKVLMEISKLVSASIRETDYVGRWGGEEFLIVLSETTLHDGYVLADQIREKIYAYDFEEIQNVSCSFGVSQCSEDDTNEALIKNADIALYEAKHSGKNKVVSSFTLA